MNRSNTKKRTVIKIGTNVLANTDGTLNLDLINTIVNQIAAVILKSDQEIVIVSSGAITCGAERLQLKPQSLPEDQAAAAIGQVFLMKNYYYFFNHYGLTTAQLLLTKEGLKNPKRSNNAKNTLSMLLTNGAIPVINENDSVATEEIEDTFSDNDQLAFLIAQLIKADQLLLLTDTDGLHTKNPKKFADAERIECINFVSEDILSMVDDNDTMDRSKGGMHSKLSIAKQASESGIDVMIACGTHPSVINDFFDGKSIGTRFPKH